MSLGGKGDVLVMSGTCQRDWEHCVPKRTAGEGARINLTFRTVLSMRKFNKRKNR